MEKEHLKRIFICCPYILCKCSIIYFAHIVDDEVSSYVLHFSLVHYILKICLTLHSQREVKVLLIGMNFLLCILMICSFLWSHMSIMDAFTNENMFWGLPGNLEVNLCCLYFLSVENNIVLLSLIADIFKSSMLLVLLPAQ